MAAVLSPIMVGVPSVKTGGSINSGGYIYTYLAGTTTAAATYTDNTLGTPNANPIVLNSYGLAPSEIWWNSGTYFKFIVKDSSGNTIGTYDNLIGINDGASTTPLEWTASGLTPTYISATSFSVTGNQTSILVAGRRIKTTNTAGTIYSTIATSAYSTVTTLTVINDSGTLDSGLSDVAYNINSASWSFLQTLQTPTGTNATFSNLPTWVKKITMTLIGLSGDGGSNWRVQIGDATGSMATTGYLGSATALADAGAVAIDNATSGWEIKIGAAAAIVHGSITITLINPATYQWAASGVFARSDAARTLFTAGSVTISGVLDRCRIVTTNSENFDAGSVNILLE